MRIINSFAKLMLECPVRNLLTELGSSERRVVEVHAAVDARDPAFFGEGAGLRVGTRGASHGAVETEADFLGAIVLAQQFS